MSDTELNLSTIPKRHVTALDGRISLDLPDYDLTEVRPVDQLVGRALVMLALFNISLDAPTEAIRDWIQENNLDSHVAPSERVILAKSDDALTERDTRNLSWYIEGIWALMWAGSLIPDLAVDQDIAKNMSSLTPNIEENDNGDRFSKHMVLRPAVALYAMRDLHYHVHSCIASDRLTGRPSVGIDEGNVIERRKALEWLCDASTDWDEVSLDT